MAEAVFEGGYGVHHCRGAQLMAQAAQVAGVVVDRLSGVIARPGLFRTGARYRLGGGVPVRGMVMAMIMFGNRSAVVGVSAGGCLHCRDGNHGLFAPDVAQDHAAAGKSTQRHAGHENQQQDGVFPGTNHRSTLPSVGRSMQYELAFDASVLH